MALMNSVLAVRTARATTTKVALVLASVIICACDVRCDSRAGTKGDKQLQRLHLGKAIVRQAGRKSKCSNEFRLFNGVCTNDVHRRWGAANTPLYSYFGPRSSTVASGKNLPSARLLSNIVAAQTGNVFNKRRLSEMVVFFGQFLDHTLVATASNKRDPMPIAIPPNDPVFSKFPGGRLPFFRSVRGRVGVGQRAINQLSSAVDLAAVYSSNWARSRALRTFKGGLMRTSSDNLMPLSAGGAGIAAGGNQYFGGDHRANENPVLTSLHTLFMREHNLLCSELKAVYPKWSDARLFETARKVNIAQFQKIVYTEWLPRIMGRSMGTYLGYRAGTSVAVSDLFATAAFRLGHTMIGNDIARLGKGNRPMAPLKMREMFFRPADVVKRDGIEPFLRGAMRRRAQEVDTLVVSALRNFLFTNVVQEVGFDLIAMNIQRGRDHALPCYNVLRQRFGGGRARSFADVTKRADLQRRLRAAYGTVDLVEAWPGLMAEDHAVGSSLGPTLLRIWMSEFSRLREGDRFFYMRPGLFPTWMWKSFPRLRRMMAEKDTMTSIILRNTQVTKAEIGFSIWKA